MSELSRRHFLTVIGASAALVGCSNDESKKPAADKTSNSSQAAKPGATTTMPKAPELAADPFTLGVASGDPLVDRVILWTRLAVDPLNGGGMPAEDIKVVWEVSKDDSFKALTASGIADATQRYGHSVHVDVKGLEANSWYSYRFRVGNYTSPIGRTRTLPKPGATADRLEFGFASCQAYNDGFYNAWADVTAHQLDLIAFLGDYIYEYPEREGSTSVRKHIGPELSDVESYRNRYALYRSDEHLRAAHALCPWVVVWDDHEVENNYASTHGENEGEPNAPSPEEFAKRRAAAYQAWWEHMPIRSEPPKDTDIKIYRSFEFGNLASLFMLDTRQYRDNQACGDAILSLKPPCDEVKDPTRTLMGKDQEKWLLDGLDSSKAKWNIIGNQVVMTPIKVGDAILNFDQWDGYPVERQRLLTHLVDKKITNTVVITGDIHIGGVGDLHANGGDKGDIVATELVGTSIASDAGIAARAEPLIGKTLPQIKYFNARQRGWCHNVVTPEKWTAEFRVVADNLVEGSPSTTDATFTITPDRPGAQRV